MSYCDLFGPDAKVDKLTDQPTGNRVRVSSHVDRAAARDAHALDDIVRVKLLVRKSIQVRKIIKELLPPVAVGSFDEVFHEGDVLLATLKVPIATQQ